MTSPRAWGAFSRASRQVATVPAACRQAEASGQALSASSSEARSRRAPRSSPRLGPAASVVHHVMAFCKLALAAVTVSPALQKQHA